MNNYVWQLIISLQVCSASEHLDLANSEKNRYGAQSLRHVILLYSITFNF